MHSARMAGPSAACRPHLAATSRSRQVQRVYAFKGPGVSRSLRLQDAIHTKLTAALQPTSLNIIDESPEPKLSRAATLSGLSPAEAAELHFRVEVVSGAFAGLSQVKRQRLVYQTLEDEVREELHALALWTKTPEEAAKLQKAVLETVQLVQE